MEDAVPESLEEEIGVPLSRQPSISRVASEGRGGEMDGSKNISEKLRANIETTEDKTEEEASGDVITIVTKEAQAAIIADEDAKGHMKWISWWHMSMDEQAYSLEAFDMMDEATNPDKTAMAVLAEAIDQERSRPFRRPQRLPFEEEDMSLNAAWVDVLKRLLCSWRFAADDPKHWIKPESLPLYYKFAMKRPIMDQMKLHIVLLDMKIQPDFGTRDDRYGNTREDEKGRMLLRGKKDRRGSHVSTSMGHLKPAGARLEDWRDEISYIRTTHEAQGQLLQPDRIQIANEHDESEEELNTLRGMQESSNFENNVKSEAKIIEELTLYIELYRSGEVDLHWLVGMVMESMKGVPVDPEAIEESANDLEISPVQAATELLEATITCIVALPIEQPDQMSIAEKHSAKEEEIEASLKLQNLVERWQQFRKFEGANERDAEVIEEITVYIQLYRSDKLDLPWVIDMIKDSMAGISVDTGLIEAKVLDYRISPAQAAKYVWEDAIASDDPVLIQSREREGQAKASDNGKAIDVESQPSPLTVDASQEIDSSLTSMTNRAPVKDNSDMLNRRNASAKPKVETKSTLPGIPVIWTENDWDGKIPRNERISSPEDGMTDDLYGIPMPSTLARRLAVATGLSTKWAAKEIRSGSIQRKARKLSIRKNSFVLPHDKRRRSSAGIIAESKRRKHPTNEKVRSQESDGDSKRDFNSPEQLGTGDKIFRNGDDWDLFARDGETAEDFVRSHCEPSSKSGLLCPHCDLISCKCEDDSLSQSDSRSSCPQCDMRPCLCEGSVNRLGSIAEHIPQVQEKARAPQGSVAKNTGVSPSNSTSAWIFFVRRALDTDNVFGSLNWFKANPGSDYTLNGMYSLLTQLHQCYRTGELTVDFNEVSKLIQSILDSSQELSDYNGLLLLDNPHILEKANAQVIDGNTSIEAPKDSPGIVDVLGGVLNSDDLPALLQQYQQNQESEMTIQGIRKIRDHLAVASAGLPAPRNEADVKAYATIEHIIPSARLGESQEDQLRQRTTSRESPSSVAKERTTTPLPESDPMCRAFLSIYPQTGLLTRLKLLEGQPMSKQIMNEVSNFLKIKEQRVHDGHIPETPRPHDYKDAEALAIVTRLRASCRPIIAWEDNGQSLERKESRAGMGVTKSTAIASEAAPRGLGLLNADCGPLLTPESCEFDDGKHSLPDLSAASTPGTGQTDSPENSSGVSQRLDNYDTPATSFVSGASSSRSSPKQWTVQHATKDHSCLEHVATPVLPQTSSVELSPALPAHKVFAPSTSSSPRRKPPTLVLRPSKPEMSISSGVNPPKPTPTLVLRASKLEIGNSKDGHGSPVTRTSELTGTSVPIHPSRPDSTDSPQNSSPCMSEIDPGPPSSPRPGNSKLSGMPVAHRSEIDVSPSPQGPPSPPLSPKARENVLPHLSPSIDNRNRPLGEHTELRSPERAPRSDTPIPPTFENIEWVDYSPQLYRSISRSPPSSGLRDLPKAPRPSAMSPNVLFAPISPDDEIVDPEDPFLDECETSSSSASPVSTASFLKPLHLSQSPVPRNRALQPPKLPGPADERWAKMKPSAARKFAQTEALRERKSLFVFMSERRAVRARLKQMNDEANAKSPGNRFYQTSNGPSGTSSSNNISKLFDKYRGVLLAQQSLD